ncbi:MAG: hypothetical protein ACOVRN_01110 [Flavobacterium sp.]
MPKGNIDYSNTIIYKLYCKDAVISDFYIGHTTNFAQRKYAHKMACSRDVPSALKIHCIIRQNGGWENWTMEEVARVHCRNAVEAKQKEAEYLASNFPNFLKTSYFERGHCNPPTCDHNFKNEIIRVSPHDVSSHVIGDDTIALAPSEKEGTKRGQNGTKRDAKTDPPSTPNLSHHIASQSTVPIVVHLDHLKKEGTKRGQKGTDFKNFLRSPPTDFVCGCGKEYKHRQGLWRHEKLCPFSVTPVSEMQLTAPASEHEIKILTNLVLDVVKQNKELIDQNQELTNKIVDICKIGIQTNTISNSQINSHNKTFNLQFFLNETCKNAMNITDFINSLQLQLSDLENVGKLGYADGISSIIVKNLNALDETTRPIHCTDKKREIFYIKDEDKWERDDEEKKKIKNVIDKVACKNQKLLNKFKELHPGCNFSESTYADQYSKLVIEAMGGMGNNDKEKEDKIIRNIAKEVTISKQKGLDCID